MKRHVVRDRWVSRLHERFLLASISTVLLIRLYLAVTGYPQLGGGGLHISHMLWGGLGMLVSMILSLTFIGRRMQASVALLGGIGFGTFIDELGKFITSSNDYFFQPTLFLIYSIYTILLLIFLLLERLPQVSRQERLTNVLFMLVEADTHNLQEQDKKELLFLLRGHDMQEHRLKWLAVVVERMPAVIILFFVGYAFLLSMLGGLYLRVSNVTTDVVEIGWLVCSLVSYGMIVIGMVYVRKAQLTAFRWFVQAILVSIFLTQSFLVLMQPMSALVALLINLIVLAALNFLIYTEMQGTFK